jgi:hypothetical protein
MAVLKVRENAKSCGNIGEFLPMLNSVLGWNFKYRGINSETLTK